MELNQYINTHYSKYFEKILPLSIHPLYSRDLEFSDKIIVPRSIYKDLLRNKLPFPTQFIIVPDRSMHNSIHCTVLEFSAEEDFIYLPFWMLRELGFKVFNKDKGVHRYVKAGYGVTLTLLETVITNCIVSYAITRCTYLEFFCGNEASTESIKDEISKYLFVREDSEMTICINDVILIVKIIKLSPTSIAIIQGEFQCIRLSEIPVKSKIVKEEGTSTDVLEQKIEKFPNFPEKLPRFLIEIIKKRNNITINPNNSKSTAGPSGTSPKKYHRKINSYNPIESPNILQCRIDTPEIEKYIAGHYKNTEVGKSLEDSTGILPPLYHSPIKMKKKSPKVLSITIPELTQKSPIITNKNVKKVPIWFKSRKERSVTPFIKPGRESNSNYRHLLFDLKMPKK